MFISKQDRASENRVTMELEGFDVTDFAGHSNLQPQNMRSQFDEGIQLNEELSEENNTPKPRLIVEKANQDVELVKHLTETRSPARDHHHPTIQDVELMELSPETRLPGVDDKQPTGQHSPETRSGAMYEHNSTADQENTRGDTEAVFNTFSAQLHFRNTDLSEWNSKGSVSCQSTATLKLNEAGHQTVTDTSDGASGDSVTQVNESKTQTELPDKRASEAPSCAGRPEILLDGEFNTETKSPQNAELKAKMSPELPRGVGISERAQAPHDARVTVEGPRKSFDGEFNNETLERKVQIKTSLDAENTRAPRNAELTVTVPSEPAQAPPCAEGCDTLLDKHLRQYRELLKFQPCRQTEVSLSKRNLLRFLAYLHCRIRITIRTATK